MRRVSSSYRRIPAGAIKIDLPNTTQVTDYTCGASALLAIASYFGVGPEDEWDVEADMGFDTEGADPKHILPAATKYGLRVRRHAPMSLPALARCLDLGHPVILMIQAWADDPPRSYARRWTDGHWVVAIGYDAEVFYFEDPSIHGGRGFIARRELLARWHDIEGSLAKHRRVQRLGLEVWADRIGPFSSTLAARHID